MSDYLIATNRQSISQIFKPSLHPWLVIVSVLFPVSQLDVARPGQLDRELRRLGRSLVLSEEEGEDDDDYDDDLMDLEASNVIFTPLLRSVCTAVSSAHPDSTHLF